MISLDKKIGQQGSFQIFLERLYRVTKWKRLPLILLIAALICGIATYVVLTTSSHDVGTVYWLLNADLVILLALGTLVARQIVKLWMRRKEGAAGSRLHVRLVFVFSLLTALPAIMMAIFSSFFFYFGIQAWFNDRVSTAVNQSLTVAQAYLSEHQQIIKSDVLAMANDLNREAPYLVGNPTALQKVVQTQSHLRNLSEAIVFTSSGKVLARSRLTFTLEFDPIPESHLAQARTGEVVLLTGDTDDRIRALVKLDNFVDVYLFVGRLVDGAVLEHMKSVEDAVQEYTELEGRRSSLQISVTLMFVAVAFLLLLAAVWFGLLFARSLATPISELIGAAEKVRSGDLSVRVNETGQDDELGTLGIAFNRMTSQLEAQTQELLEANRMLNERRRFTEAVLAGTSSGIVGLDHDGRITLANIVLAELLGFENPEDLTGQSLTDLIEETAPLIKDAYGTRDGLSQIQIDYQDKEGRIRTFLIRITVEKGDLETASAVVTFDDISALMSAQRKAAWSDVARRIAHEIKNPLTPILLSAERLKRRYLEQITDDPEVFEKCTNTIIRQVTEIGRMVGEFASFARMPDAVKKTTNVVELCQEDFTLQKQANSDIKFKFKASKKMLLAECDRGQISQVMTNLLQNAIDAVQEKSDKTDGFKGEVSLNVETEKGNIIRISVSDNGPGLPEDNMKKLVEPYVTTKKKGTGLGLAIVKKILEDHNGMISLENWTGSGDNEGGACISVTLPLKE